MFQSYALFPHRSVEKNVAFGLERKRVDRAEVKRRVAEELERVGLSAEAKRRPAQLSGGQQQRVALARALVNRPAVLLLDEPLGALDLKLRKQLQVELKRIQRDVGITFVYVTHDQEEALTMSDRIAVINRGVVEQVADPETVYERPGTTFVAGFIGVSNLMPGEVVSARNGAGAELKLDAGPDGAHRPSGGASARERVHAVVRPEKLVLSGAGEPRADGASVEGQVESSLYLGTATQMVLLLGDGTRMTVLVPNADAAGPPRPAGRRRGGPAFVVEREHPHRQRRGGRPTTPPPAATETSQREERQDVSPIDDDLDRHFERLLRDPLTRRRLMKRGAAGALSVSALAYLAACGTDDPGGGDGGSDSEDQKAIKKGEISDSLYFANWPLYIEEDRGTLKEFEKEYGTKVKYVEEINDNTEFFGKVRQQYDQGDSGGRDIHVVTDWMAARMMRLGYVQKFDKKRAAERSGEPDRSSQVAALRPRARVLGARGSRASAGIVYRKDKVKREPKSIDDLFDPDYKGKVTMLTEMRDSVGLVAASMGADPEKASLDEFLAAVEKIGEGAESGQIRGLHRQRIHQGPRQGRLLGDHRLVGRLGAAAGRQPEYPVRRTGDRASPVDRQHADPRGRAGGVHGAEDDRLRLPARGPGRHRRVRELHLPGERREGDPHRARSGARAEPADLP